MVKVNGPLMSLAASGTLGDAVTFSQWKGRAYVRERVIPSNPKSGAQLGRRAMLTFLAERWQPLLDSNKVSWQDLADQLVASPFNGYMSDNMQNWHNFLPPTKNAARLKTGNGSDRALSAAAWEENRIKISSTATTANQRWGIIIFAKLAGAVTAAVGTAIIVRHDSTLANEDDFWTPPTVGTWHFNSMTFSVDGVLEAAGGAQNAAPP